MRLQSYNNQPHDAGGGVTDADTENSDVYMNNSENRNESRQILSPIISIQRAWRRYRLNKNGAALNGASDLNPSATAHCANRHRSGAQDGASCSAVQVMASSIRTDDNSSQRSEDDDIQFDSADDLDSVQPVPPVLTTDNRWYNRPAPYSLAARCGIDSEPESIASDYSEMAEPIREHLANVQIIRREDLDLGNAFSSNQYAVGQRIRREADEDDDTYNRRVRKTNLLSLAQEFAALKRIKADALPFDLHEEKYRECAGMEDWSDEDEVEERNPKVTVPLNEKSDILPSTTARNTHLSNLDTSTTISTSLVAGTVVTKFSEANISNPGATNSESISVQPDVVVPCVPAAMDTLLVLQSNTHLRHDSPQHIVGHSIDAVSGAGASDTKGSPSRGRNMEDPPPEEFDVYTMETSLPAMDWQRLEEQLLRAAEDEQNRRSRCGDREEIRRKLAMGDDISPATVICGGGYLSSSSSTSSLQRKHNMHGRHHSSGMNLQMCYVNDAAADLEDSGQDDDIPILPRSRPDVIPQANQYDEASASACFELCSADEDEDFFSRQAHLQAEAKLALAQIRPMAHMQLQLEKQQLKKKSPIAEIVSIPGFTGGKSRQMNRRVLERMNLAQLQVVVNSLHAQIEGLNMELMQQLVDRDDLHMAQDSMLVDIEDLTGRAQEFADRVSKMAAGGTKAADKKGSNKYVQLA